MNSAEIQGFPRRWELTPTLIRPTVTAVVGTMWTQLSRLQSRSRSIPQRDFCGLSPGLLCRMRGPFRLAPLSCWALRPDIARLPPQTAPVRYAICFWHTVVRPWQARAEGFAYRKTLFSFLGMTLVWYWIDSESSPFALDGTSGGRFEKERVCVESRVSGALS